MADQKPVAYLHLIVEPYDGEQKLLSFTTDHPWLEWFPEYLAQCVYSCTPLVPIEEPSQ